MNWEDIYNKMIKYNVFCDSPQCQLGVRAILESELHNKIIIAKGETLQAKFRSWWGSVLTISENTEYRIKPSEPVYVYQYAYLEHRSDPTWEMSAYMTDDEFKNCGLSHADFQAKKCEWTKKERKND